MQNAIFWTFRGGTYVKIETVAKLLQIIDSINKYDLFRKCHFLNFHFDFWEQLFSDISVKVLCYIAAFKVMCHSCCITKAEISVEKHFLKLDLKGIMIYNMVQSKNLWRFIFYVDATGDSLVLSPLSQGPFLQKSKSGLQ